ARVGRHAAPRRRRPRRVAQARRDRAGAAVGGADPVGAAPVSEYLPFIVIGLATGSVYAIAAMGLTVTYTTSGVFNFAHGAVGMIATFIFYSLRVNMGVPTALAMAIAVLGVGPAIGNVIECVLLCRFYVAT